MPACHAGGHGFESRTHRSYHGILRNMQDAFLFYIVTDNIFSYNIIKTDYEETYLA